MAEEELAQRGPDSAPTPPPKKKRRGSLARMMRPDPTFEAAWTGANSLSHHFRQMDAATAPLRAMMEKAEEFHRQIEAAIGDFADEDDEAQPPAPQPTTSRPAAPAAAPSPPAPAPPPPPPAATPPKPERWKPPASTDADIPDGWALYERRDSPAWLVDRIRAWWPPFTPGVVEHWFRLEKEIKNLRHELRADERPPQEFEQERLRWAPEDLVAYMEEIRMIPKRAPRPKPGRPRKRVAELDVDQWIAAQLVTDPTFRHLSERAAEKLGPFKARTIGQSKVWKGMKRQLAEETDAASERARAEFEGRQGEDEEQPGIRVGRKSALGRQRTTQEERDHNRAAEDFIRNAEARPKRKK